MFSLIIYTIPFASFHPHIPTAHKLKNQSVNERTSTTSDFQVVIHVELDKFYKLASDNPFLGHYQKYLEVKIKNRNGVWNLYYFAVTQKKKKTFTVAKNKISWKRSHNSHKISTQWMCIICMSATVHPPTEITCFVITRNIHMVSVSVYTLYNRMAPPPKFFFFCI